MKRGQPEGQGQDEERLGTVRLGGQRRQAEGRRQIDDAEGHPALLLSHPDGEEGGEEHDAEGRDVETLGLEELRVPATVENEGPEHGEGSRLRPGLGAVQDHGPGAEEEEVGEQRESLVLTRREQHRGQIAADPREGRQEASVETRGEEDRADRHEKQQPAGRAPRDEGVEGMGAVEGRIEAGETGSGEALPEGPVLVPQQPQASGEEGEADGAAKEHTPRGADPVVLPGVFHEEAEGHDHRQSAHSHQDLGSQVRREIAGGGRRAGRPWGLERPMRGDRRRGGCGTRSPRGGRFRGRRGRRDRSHRWQDLAGGGRRRGRGDLASIGNHPLAERPDSRVEGKELRAQRVEVPGDVAGPDQRRDGHHGKDEEQAETEESKNDLHSQPPWLSTAGTRPGEYYDPQGPAPGSLVTVSILSTREPCRSSVRTGPAGHASRRSGLRGGSRRRSPGARPRRV